MLIMQVFFYIIAAEVINVSCNMLSPLLDIAGHV